MKQKEQGFGARSLPNRNYISQMVTAVMHQGEGLEFTVTTLWNDLPLSTRDTLVNAYGGSVEAKRAVQRCVQNMHNLHGNPAKIRGRGKKATYIYNHETDKAGRKDVVFTTETPEESGIHVGQHVLQDLPEEREPFMSKAEDQLVVEKDGKLEPVTFSPVEVPVSQVGDQTTYTLVGLFLDGTFLWREESTGHVGSIEFTAL